MNYEQLYNDFLNSLPVKYRLLIQEYVDLVLNNGSWEITDEYERKYPLIFEKGTRKNFEVAFEEHKTELLKRKELQVNPSLIKQFGLTDEEVQEIIFLSFVMFTFYPKEEAEKYIKSLPNLYYFKKLKVLDSFPPIRTIFNLVEKSLKDLEKSLKVLYLQHMSKINNLKWGNL